MNMWKWFLAIGIAFVETVGLPDVQNVAKPTAPVVKTKVLSPMMEANAKQFKQLKDNLGISEAELTQTDVLELIVLAYAKMFDGLEARVIDLERRSIALENESLTLRKDTDTLQKQAKTFDEDLTKLFNWSEMIDDELHNNLAISGINYELRKLRQDVASDLDSHGEAIDRNTKSVRSLQQNVNQNCNAIRDLINAIRSIR